MNFKSSDSTAAALTVKLVTPEEGGAGNNVQQGDQASYGPRHNWCPRFSLPNRVDPEHGEAGTRGSTFEHPGVVATPDHQLAPRLPSRPEHHLVSISKPQVLTHQLYISRESPNP